MPLMQRTTLALAAISLVLTSSPALAQVTVSVDASADLKPISPLIYGVNFPTVEQLQSGLTAARWGGNSTTRYNYTNDVRNTAADYYFENIPGCFGGVCPPSDPQEQSGANAFLKDASDHGAIALLTIPTMGWVAKSPPVYDHPFPCGCPKTVTPNQDSFDPYDTNCGNGKAPGGQSGVACAPPSATSVDAPPSFAGAWAQYLAQKFGAAGGKRIYALDNEPMLWRYTHYDLRGSQPLGYDELWQRMRDYADAILDADPTAEIAGPAEWGYPNYFCSNVDGAPEVACAPDSPDRKAHGGVELMAWLLDQAKQYEAQKGRRILHYLDLHYYPQGGNPPDNLRSLWDPSYVDPSWINDTIKLIPRMRDWVDQHYPGTKIAISEFDFYDHDSALGAVTYAEVLGIFGREGVSLATAWAPPAANERAFLAYKLFRNYDGSGGTFEGVSARATVTGSGVAAFAGVGPKRVTVALVNEQGGPVDVEVALGSFEPDAMASVYSNQGGATIDMLPSVPVAAGKVSLTLAGTSITMLVVNGNNPNMLPDAGSSSSSSTSTSSSGAGGSGGSGGGGNGSSSSGGCGCGIQSDAQGALAAVATAALVAAFARRNKRRRALKGS